MAYKFSYLFLGTKYSSRSSSTFDSILPTQVKGSFFFLNIYLFIWPCLVIVVARDQIRAPCTESAES